MALNTRIRKGVTSGIRTARITLVVLTLLKCAHTYAGIETMIKNVMPKGTMHNVTRGAIVKDQLSGHYVGGSVMIKSPVNNELQLISARAPKACIGGLPCNAQIDLRAGAFSFIKSAELTRFLKDMLVNVGPYAAVMAVKTICPQCENLMTWLEGIQRDMNKFGVLTCQAMMAPIVGAFSKLESAAQANRQSNMVTTSEKSDMLHNGDRARKDIDRQDPAPNNVNLKEQLGDKFNLVWKALAVKAESGAISSDVSLRELLMSISGTIIINKDAKPTAVNLGSLANEDLIDEYIGTGKGAGNIDLYVCDEQTRCLDPRIEKKRISAKDTLYGRVDALITSIVKKAKVNRGDFTEEEEELINLSSIPIVNKVQMDLATHPSSAEANVRMTEFIEALCYDVVTNHFMRMLQKTTVAVNELSHMQLSDTGVFEKFEGQARDVMQLLTENRAMALKRYDLIAQTRMRMRQEESYFETKFEEYIGNSFIEG